ncbi:MAG: hypothetical protein FWD91_06105 [Treponema sp.]|nr:hypothetical protein [Treponema sp.]
MTADTSNVPGVFRAKLPPFKVVLLQSLLFLAVIPSARAQEEVLLEEHPALRERAVVLRIVSRVEENEKVVWNAEMSRVTLPGRPVGMRLVGDNVVVAVQFTPVLRPEGQHILVAQGQIWINVPGQGMSYHTTLQTIPLNFHEEVFFFPLGSLQAENEALIEIQLVVEPHSGTFNGRRSGRDRDRDSAPQVQAHDLE